MLDSHLKLQSHIPVVFPVLVSFIFGLPTTVLAYAIGCLGKGIGFSVRKEKHNETLLKMKSRVTL